MFPAIEAIHLLALSILGGAILVVDLRLIGLGLRNQPVAALARTTHPYLIGALAMMFLTGAVLFTSGASLRYYYNPPFWGKMRFLLAALIFTFTVRHIVSRTDEADVDPVWDRLTGLTSLVLWFGVGFSGRWIAYW